MSADRRQDILKHKKIDALCAIRVVVESPISATLANQYALFTVLKCAAFCAAV